MASLAFRRRSIAALQRAEQSRPQRDDERKHGATDRGQDPNGDGTGEDPQVERKCWCATRRRSAQLLLNDRLQPLHRSPRSNQRQHCRGNTNDDGFGDQHPCDRAASGAERRADRQLPFAPRRSYEQQSGDIRTPDEQHEARSGGCRLQHRPDLKDVRFVRGDDHYIETGRNGSRWRGHEGLDAFGRGGRRNSVTQSGHVWIRWRAERDQDVGVRIDMPEALRQHSDDRELLGLVRPIADVRSERPADDRWIARVALGPETMADERNIRPPRHECAGVEATSNCRLDSEAFDEAWRDPRTREGLRVIPTQHVEHVEIPCDGMFDHVVQRAPVERLEAAKSIRVRRFEADPVQAVGGGIREAAEQIRLDHDHRRRAQRHAERERQHSSGGKALRLEEHAAGTPQVDRQSSHGRRTYRPTQC